MGDHGSAVKHDAEGILLIRRCLVGFANLIVSSVKHRSSDPDPSTIPHAPCRNTSSEEIKGYIQ